MTNCYRKLLLFLSLSLMMGAGQVSAASLVGPIQDPLLPTQQGDRPLSESQAAQLTQTIITLEAEGFEQWAEGNKEAAFSRWWRHL